MHKSARVVSGLDTTLLPRAPWREVLFGILKCQVSVDGLAVGICCDYLPDADGWSLAGSISSRDESIFFSS